MAQFNSFSDILSFAKTFGADAINFALKNNTLSMDDSQLILNAKKDCISEKYEIDSFNDGNNVYEIMMFVKSSKDFLGDYDFTFNDITIIRYGFGEGTYTIFEFMEEATPRHKREVSEALTVFRERNKMRDALGL